MSVHRKLAGGILAGSLLFTTAACGGGGGSDSGNPLGNKANDKLAEKIAKENGVDVNIDSKNGTYTYTDENGNETKVDVNGKGDGGYTVTDENGNETQVGTGAAELPEDWPEDLQPPDGVTLVSSSTSTQGDKKTLSVIANADTDVKTLYGGLKTQLKDGGYEISSDMNGGSGSDAYASLAATKGDVSVSVSMGSGNGDGTTSIIFTVEMPA